ncbi:hypothetical protein [Sphingomonas xinjiangensis]|uniref:ABM domain-containing protein n=1 Tax=Sphingomonas xinjiangensis TaxID=643568 RepID=A0A840YBH7_9SPHN|nr:hypothetical protein [Sphingomonas xinjiangensis]MBB5710697.1 hypothetical protein [Sphingomonas xinjiangensis]
MQPSATLIESFAVHPARNEKFLAWRHAYGEAIGEAPGHCETTGLEQPAGLNHLVSRFESDAALKAWISSEAYRAMVRESAAFSARLVQHGTGNAQSFAIPSDATARKWKRFVVVWASVLPILLVLNTAVRTLLPGLPPLVQLCVTSPILTALLTWVVLPRVQRWSSYWTLQGGDGKLRRHPD